MKESPRNRRWSGGSRINDDDGFRDVTRFPPIVTDIRHEEEDIVEQVDKVMVKPRTESCRTEKQKYNEAKTFRSLGEKQLVKKIEDTSNNVCSSEGGVTRKISSSQKLKKIIELEREKETTSFNTIDCVDKVDCSLIEAGDVLAEMNSALEGINDWRRGRELKAASLLERFKDVHQEADENQDADEGRYVDIDEYALQSQLRRVTVKKREKEQQQIEIDEIQRLVLERKNPASHYQEEKLREPLNRLPDTTKASIEDEIIELQTESIHQRIMEGVYSSMQAEYSSEFFTTEESHEMPEPHGLQEYADELSSILDRLDNVDKKFQSHPLVHFDQGEQNSDDQGVNQNN